MQDSSAGFFIDSARFPLVFVQYPRILTPEAIDDFIERLKKEYRNGKLAVVVNISDVDVTARQRAYVAKRIDEVTRAFPNTVIAEAVITPSAILRGMVTAYNWMKTDKSYPTRCFKEKDAAFEWALGRIENEGLPVTPE